MKWNDDSVILEVYALVDSADYSYLGLNKVLSNFRCSLLIVPVNEFEQKFRQVFHLSAYAGQIQTKQITLINKANQQLPVYVTDELYGSRLNGSSGNDEIIRKGYVVLFKKSFAFYTNNSATIPDDEIQKCIATTEQFISSVNRCMCVSGYSLFKIRSTFAYMPGLKKIIQYGKSSRFSYSYAKESFNEKDNYFIKLYLRSETRQQPNTRFAIDLFSNAMTLKNPQQQFLQTFLSLQACFTGTSQNEIRPDRLSHYIFVLTNEYRDRYSELQKEVEVITAISHSLLPQTRVKQRKPVSESYFNERKEWLAYITHTIFKKLIRMNHIQRDRLVYGLEKRFIELSKSFNSIQKD